MQEIESIELSSDISIPRTDEDRAAKLIASINSIEVPYSDRIDNTSSDDCWVTSDEGAANIDGRRLKSSVADNDIRQSVDTRSSVTGDRNAAATNDMWIDIFQPNSQRLIGKLLITVFCSSMESVAV